jgi:hypothetical protein
VETPSTFCAVGNDAIELGFVMLVAAKVTGSGVDLASNSKIVAGACKSVLLSMVILDIIPCGGG